MRPALALLALLLVACTADPPFEHLSAGRDPKSPPANLTSPDVALATTTTAGRVASRRASRGAIRPRVTPRPLPTGDVWYRLRLCESHDNYADKYNPTYRGAYQFSFSTWRSVGGTGDPADAPPAEQDMRAQMLAARSNPYGQWPVCWPRAVGG